MEGLEDNKMAGTDTLIAFFLFVVVILLGVLLFFLVVDRLDDNDTSTPTGNVVKEYYFIEDKNTAPKTYNSGSYKSPCLGSFFSCLLRCHEDKDDEDLFKESCTNDCEDDLYYSCSDGSYFQGESDANMQRYQCLENCQEGRAYNIACTRNCIY